MGFGTISCHNLRASHNIAIEFKASSRDFVTGDIGIARVAEHEWSFLAESSQAYKD